MRVLVACESSGTVRRAFQARGHEAYSVDLLPADDGETKKTGLWLRGLPKLVPTDIVEGREQRVWRMGPSPERWKERSKTYQGIADAMANQWGSL